MTNYRIRQLGSQLKAGTAQIIGRTTGTGLDDATYIIDDLERQTTEHVLCCVRPSWGRYIA